MRKFTDSAHLFCVSDKLGFNICQYLCFLLVLSFLFLFIFILRGEKVIATDRLLLYEWATTKGDLLLDRKGQYTVAQNACLWMQSISAASVSKCFGNAKYDIMYTVYSAWSQYYLYCVALYFLVCCYLDYLHNIIRQINRQVGKEVDRQAGRQMDGQIVNISAIV